MRCIGKAAHKTHRWRLFRALGCQLKWNRPGANELNFRVCLSKGARLNPLTKFNNALVVQMYGLIGRKGENCSCVISCPLQSIIHDAWKWLKFQLGMNVYPSGLIYVYLKQSIYLHQLYGPPDIKLSGTICLAWAGSNPGIIKAKLMSPNFRSMFLKTFLRCKSEVRKVFVFFLFFPWDETLRSFI